MITQVDYTLAYGDADGLCYLDRYGRWSSPVETNDPEDILTFSTRQQARERQRQFHADGHPVIIVRLTTLKFAERVR